MTNKKNILKQKGIKVECKDLSYYYAQQKNKEVLQKLNVVFEPNTFNVVLGRSGCGKSTFLRILAGLQEPTEGLVLLDDESSTQPSLEKSLIFQETELFPWLKVNKILEFVLKKSNREAANQNNNHFRVIVNDILERLNLGQAGDLYPHQLSGGMAQRVAFAATIAQGARLWLMDEPFASLDPDIRQDMRDLLLELWQYNSWKIESKSNEIKSRDIHNLSFQPIKVLSSNKTIVFVTHDIEDVLHLAEHLYYMEDGKFTRYLDFSDLDYEQKEHFRAEILDWFRADDTSKVENLNAKG